MTVNGSLIQYLRLEKKLTQATLAEILGVSKAKLTAVENNLQDPNAATLKRIADYFGVTVDSLYKK